MQILEDMPDPRRRSLTRLAADCDADELKIGEVNRAREVHWCLGKVLNVGLAYCLDATAIIYCRRRLDWEAIRREFV